MGDVQKRGMGALVIAVLTVSGLALWAGFVGWL